MELLRGVNTAVLSLVLVVILGIGFMVKAGLDKRDFKEAKDVMNDIKKALPDAASKLKEIQEKGKAFEKAT